MVIPHSLADHNRAVQEYLKVIRERAQEAVNKCVLANIDSSALAHQ
jgi:hypothetical protein